MQKFATLNILLIAAGLCSFSEIGKNLYDDDSYWQANIQNISMDFAQTFTVFSLRSDAAARFLCGYYSRPSTIF